MQGVSSGQMRTLALAYGFLSVVLWWVADLILHQLEGLCHNSEQVLSAL